MKRKETLRKYKPRQQELLNVVASIQALFRPHRHDAHVKPHKKQLFLRDKLRKTNVGFKISILKLPGVITVISGKCEPPAAG